jgi:hypothetical protein
VGYLAGEVFQVVCPRAADNDGIVQWESTDSADSELLYGESMQSSAFFTEKKTLRTNPQTAH